LERLQQNNAPHIVFETKTEEVGAETTISSTFVVDRNGDLQSVSSSVGTKSKSDLYADEIIEDDVDGISLKSLNIIKSFKNMSKYFLFSQNVDCIEGDVMKVSCNTCVCSDGRYFCSKRACNEKDKPLPPAEKSSSKRKGGIIKYHSVKGAGDSSSQKNATNNGGGGESQNEIGNSSNNSTTTFIISEVDSNQCVDGRTKPVDCNSFPNTVYQ
jgi:hypothetical protein